MSIKEKKDRMAWFKMDVGSFIADTAGFSNNEVGIYAKLMMLYWASGNKLPTLPEQLNRKIGIFSEEDKGKLMAILQEFFPPDNEGEHHHEQLDDQLNDIRGFSKMQSDKAKKRYIPQSNSNDYDPDLEF